MSTFEGNGITVGSFCTLDGERLVMITTGPSAGIVPAEAARMLATQINNWADYAERKNAEPQTFRATYNVKWEVAGAGLPAEEAENEYVKDNESAAAK